jgi:tetrahydromethanopterin S-methyltransferase subunit H
VSLRFHYDKEQKVCDIGGLKVGGQPGENPPLLLASLFQKGDKLVESRKKRKFDREGAAERIREMERISDETGVPGIVAMVANSPDEMKAYVDFFVSVSDRPFAIDMWVQNTRVEATRYICEQGLADRLLYNSITPWDEDIPGQVQTLKELGVKHIVVQAFDAEDKTPAGRPKSLRNTLQMVGEGAFESILVDTAVMNLPATAFSLVANSLIKEEFGLPVGIRGCRCWHPCRQRPGQRFYALWTHDRHAAHLPGRGGRVCSAGDSGIRRHQSASGEQDSSFEPSVLGYGRATSGKVRRYTGGGEQHESSRARSADSARRES